MNLAPIVLFVYNRPWHTRKTVEALQENELANDSELFIFSDGAKNEMAVNSVQEVRNYIRTIDGFKNIEIIERNQNLGLANSIISGVTEVVNKYGKAIVLEDDLISSSYFLKFMNEALQLYSTREDIISITGYSYPIISQGNYNRDIYLFYRCMSWSWGTWKERWQNVNWDIDKSIYKNRIKQKKFNRGGNDLSKMLIKQYNGEIDSWAIHWCYHHFNKNGFCLYPKHSLIKNIGFDGSGVHGGSDKRMNIELCDIRNIKLDINIGIDEEVISLITNYLQIPSLLKRAYRKVKRLINEKI